MTPSLKKLCIPLAFIALCALLATSPAAFAGRPLVVEDANVNDSGHGHVEAWAARARGDMAYNVAPAYAPLEGLEIAVLLSRVSGASLTATAIQAKWRITPSRDGGCNFAAIVGVGHVTGDGDTPYVNGVATCNPRGFGSVHLNLGAARLRGTAAATTWGIAYERDIGGVTPHAEYFGAGRSKPAVQVGLRGNIADNVQLDGSAGRTDHANVYTLGVKFQF